MKITFADECNQIFFSEIQSLEQIGIDTDTYLEPLQNQFRRLYAYTKGLETAIQLNAEGDE